MRAHGVFTVEKQGGILFVDGRGPWNEEAAHAYKQELVDAANSMGESPWAILVVMHGLCLLTPETEAEFIKLTRHRMSLGMTSTALVLSDTQGRKMTENQFSRIYAEAGLSDFAFFETAEEAYSWLDKQGYKTAV